jgi:hypothetical protein
VDAANSVEAQPHQEWFSFKLKLINGAEFRLNHSQTRNPDTFVLVNPHPCGFTSRDIDALTGLERFPQLLEATEHFCCWRQKQVAKSVPYGLPTSFLHKSHMLRKHVRCEFNFRLCTSTYRMHSNKNESETS